MAVEAPRKTQKDCVQIYTDAVKMLESARAEIFNSSKEIKDNFYKAIDLKLREIGREVCSSDFHNEGETLEQKLGIFPYSELQIHDPSPLSGYRGLQINCIKHSDSSNVQVVNMQGERKLVNDQGKDVTNKKLWRYHLKFVSAIQKLPGIAEYLGLPVPPNDLFFGVHQYTDQNLIEIADKFRS